MAQLEDALSSKERC